MKSPSKHKRSRTGLISRPWLIGLTVAAFVLSFVLLSQANFTEVTPLHGGMHSLCITSAVMCGLTGAVIGWRSATGRSPGAASRDKVAIELGFVGFVIPVVVLWPAADVIYGLIDFPSSEVRTSTEMIPISGAYQSYHSRGKSRYIQTVRDWPNIFISYDDYEFMRMHRRPGDDSTDPDEIISNGYFCARLTIQRAGDAVRVMHDGWGELASGHIQICPEKPAEETNG